MRRNRYASIVVAAAVLMVSGCASDPIPRAGVEAAVATHRVRIATLLDAIDLEHPGLEVVADRVAADDLVGAADALLDYYRAAPTAGWLRSGPLVNDPGGYDGDPLAMAAEVLDDTYTFQGVTGRARRNADGAIDWRYLGPRNDFQWGLFLNRHFQFIPLLKAYAETGDPAFPAYISRVVSDWVVHNPPEDLPDEAMMSVAWQPMSAASRLLQDWPQAFFRFQDDSAFSVEARLLMLASVPEQMRHLRHHHRPHHNHTVKEMSALAHAALAWPEFSASAEWLEYAISILGRELERQVYPDGVQKELSVHYHLNVLVYYRWVVEMCRAAGKPAPDWFETRIEEMGHYLAHAMRPSGHGILNNDADLDYNRDEVAELAELFDRDDWRYIASFGAVGHEPPEGPSSYFPYAGHLISRSDWSDKAHWSWFDIGPWGLSHQHDDSLHLSVSVHGRDILVDTGRYNYTDDDPLRQHLLASAAHNVILVDGAGQNPSIDVVDEPLPNPVILGRDFDEGIGVFADGFDGVEGEITHTRAVIFDRAREFWVVVDRIETDRPRELRPLWHFHPDCTVEIDGDQILTTDEGVGNLRVIPVAGPVWSVELVKGEMEPEVQGWYSPTYGEIEASPTAVYSGRIDGTVLFGWVLVPSDGAAPRAIAEAQPAAAGMLSFRFQRDGEDPMNLVFDLAGKLPGRDKNRK